MKDPSHKQGAGWLVIDKLQAHEVKLCVRLVSPVSFRVMPSLRCEDVICHILIQWPLLWKSSVVCDKRRIVELALSMRTDNRESFFSALYQRRPRRASTATSFASTRRHDLSGPVCYSGSLVECSARHHPSIPYHHDGQSPATWSTLTAIGRGRLRVAVSLQVALPIRSHAGQAIAVEQNVS